MDFQTRNIRCISLHRQEARLLLFAKLEVRQSGFVIVENELFWSVPDWSVDNGTRDVAFESRSSSQVSALERRQTS